MKLFFLLPLFTKNLKEVKFRRDTVNEWWLKTGLPRVKDGYRFSKAEKTALEGGRSFTLRAGSAHPITISYSRHRSTLKGNSHSVGNIGNLAAFHHDPTYGGDADKADLAFAVSAISQGLSQKELRTVIEKQDLSRKGTKEKQRRYVEGIIRKAIKTTGGTLVPKGIAVRLEIFRVLDYLDQTDPLQRDDTLFIMMDGSLAFDFSNLFLIIDRLLASPRADVVFGSRPKDQMGMPRWRKSIELFEEYLLVCEYGQNIKQHLGTAILPDSQAGCWGICLSALKKLPLTAYGYELEYDLLSSTLAQNVPFGYVGPLKMGERGTSEFSSGSVDAEAIRNCVHKLRFIMHKLALTSEELLVRLDAYLKSERIAPEYALPDEYITAVATEFRTR